MSVLVVDNYDSFAYNLVQYVGEVLTDPSWGVVDADCAEDVLVRRNDEDVLVRRNDEVSIAEIRELDPDGIVVSPGPGTPAEAGVSVPIFEELSVPTLGVCLGHQALCSANGAAVGHADSVVHGKPSTVGHDGEGLFAGLPDRFEVGRYHSLAVERAALPDALVETAWTADDRRVLMGVRHRDRPHYGVQFHPESILTDVGKRLIATFCDQCTSTT